MSADGYIGKGVPDIDGARKLNGTAKYVADLDFPKALVGLFLRSPLPHAKIVNIDTSQACTLEGVKAVITGKDFTHGLIGPNIRDQVPLAKDRVRFVGEEVAAVAAESYEIARRALDLIEVQYQEIDAVFSTAQALTNGAPLVHDGKESNIACEYHIVRGDVDKAFAEADFVFEDTFATPPVNPAFLEPYGCVATYEERRLTLWTSGQSAFHIRGELSKVLGMSEGDIRVIIPYVGGGFGGKMVLRRVHSACALLAINSGSTVKMISSRSEDFVTTGPRVPAEIKVSLAVSKDGRILGKKLHAVADNGAYTGPASKIVLNMAVRSDCLYKVESVQTDAYLIYTNNVPTSAMRGYGNAQSHFAIEVQMDRIAHALGMDPLELRLRNAVDQGYTTIHGWKLHSCALKQCLDLAAQRIGWNVPRPRDGTKKRGIGLACVTHVSGNRANAEFEGSSAVVRLDPLGRVTIYSGEVDIGQGSNTIFAQLAASELQVPIEQVKVAPVDTDESPPGKGTFSSRVTTLGGKAVLAACQDAKRQIIAQGARLLGISVDQAELGIQGVVSLNHPNRCVTLAAVLKASCASDQGTGLIIGRATVAAGSEYPDENYYGDYSAGYNFGAHAVEVEVDTETGKVKVLKVAAVHDVGHAINSTAVKGQITGGVLQGVGWGLWEEVKQENGKVINDNLLDYRLPSMADSPVVETEVVESFNPSGPLGAKGVGEPALIPTAPAIVNAIYNATGVVCQEIPVTPEKLWQLLQENLGGEGEDGV